ncbi:MAG: Glu/Leu/Phe/Val dehydrogenase dimerization domain-containing protein [Chlamydiota bacterium]
MTVTEDTLVFEELVLPGYERLIKITDEPSGLKAIICIHNTTLGPALGGTRIYPYASWSDAQEDVRRLARGMTYKSALAGVGLGGGKSVIMSSPGEKTAAKLLAFGRAIRKLNGLYICAEDYGCSTEDAATISKETRFIVGLAFAKSSGDPGPFTAWGVFRGIQSVLKKTTGSDSVKDKTIAIQGLGSVGARLAETLFWNGARLVLCDVNEDKAKLLAKRYEAEVCSPEKILSVECDVLAPCALGGILNDKTIPALRCQAVAGAANNQLLKDEHADLLRQREILYAPDFVINSGGLINVSNELYRTPYDSRLAREQVHNVYDLLLTIYEIAEQNNYSTNRSAIELADYRLKYGIGKRLTPVHFHHEPIPLF